ncbi:hypothetical protein [Phormidium sp. CCY1219]|uniref:hypothetical protein n=1 Tax=Phormidium sp. CCY1219 TaxID=2886104 RepID=UPI002D1EA5E7|nr:hypothetical protein [Phormidium sp. CCY1219]MEB3831795.1 hypothetical protein [Phormidium sp. CCY1219]
MPHFMPFVKTFSLFFFPLVWVLFPSFSLLAQDLETPTEREIPCEEIPDDSELPPECIDVESEEEEPIRRRIQPTFSEEERRGFQQKGFSNFLTDALNGNSDPLGGGTIGGGVESDGGLSPISAEERGLLPSFDPTDVIIPRGGLEGKGK